MSTLRDDYPTCPGCGDAMDTVREDKRYACGQCKSVLASDSEVLAVIAAVVRDPPATIPFEPPGATVERTYTCPRCEQAMVKHTLFTIRVDRCEAHGVWFEGGELQQVLERVSLEDAREKLPLSQKIVGAGSGILLVAAYVASFLMR